MPRRAAVAAARPGRAAARRCEPLALPAAEAPDVALDLLGVDLAAGQVQVGLGDQAPLVALQRHPLGEHVVGVGQPRRAVRARLVRELDAVLVEQLAGLRQVGHDRLVRVDQVGVRDAAQVARRVGGQAGLAAPDADEARGRGTSPTPPRSRTTSAARGRAARRGARGRGRTERRRRACAPRGGRAGRRAGARCTASVISESSARTTIAVAQSATVTSRSGRAAGGAREEDDAIGGGRDVLERA